MKGHSHVQCPAQLKTSLLYAHFAFVIPPVLSGFDCHWSQRSLVQEQLPERKTRYRVAIFYDQLSNPGLLLVDRDFHRRQDPLDRDRRRDAKSRSSLLLVFPIWQAFSRRHSIESRFHPNAKNPEENAVCASTSGFPILSEYPLGELNFRTIPRRLCTLMSKAARYAAQLVHIPA